MVWFIRGVILLNLIYNLICVVGTLAYEDVMIQCCIFTLIIQIRFLATVIIGRKRQKQWQHNSQMPSVKKAANIKYSKMLVIVAVLSCLHWLCYSLCYPTLYQEADWSFLYGLSWFAFILCIPHCPRIASACVCMCRVVYLFTHLSEWSSSSSLKPSPLNSEV